ncbi:Ribonuclease 1 [Morella rubra]|uniref:Ribonuclease 1 n=1 Tax=Morella rubra TaxID=262757 RepID=A0A6A1V686_9ROSI|nr:Ribonuclease 1 [Morella rubra]
MKFTSSILLKFLILQCLWLLCVSRDFDFFYFVQQWPASYCDTTQSCCYPKTGKPAADFGIHGLWPNYQDGTYPSNCDSGNPFNEAQIADLTSSMRKSWPSLACPSSDSIAFWTHEWDKHGTCSESVLDQHGYFEAALELKNKANLLQALGKAGLLKKARLEIVRPIFACAGIKADGKSYSVGSIKEAIKEAIGYTPWIECNKDSSGNSQLYQIYLCVDTSGTDFIECPVFPSGKCNSEIEFPSF